MNTRGFTLVELLIVIIIIGVLAAIAVPSITGARERAFVSEMQSDLRNGINYQILHAADDANGHYGTTPDIEALGFTSSDRVTVTWTPATGAEAYGVIGSASHSSTAAECEIRYGRSGPGGAATIYENVVRCDTEGNVTW